MNNDDNRNQPAAWQPLHTQEGQAVGPFYGLLTSSLSLKLGRE